MMLEICCYFYNAITTQKILLLKRKVIVKGTVSHLLHKFYKPVKF